MGVDIQWQLQNEDTSETAGLARSCLTANGIAPAATLNEMWDQLTTAHLDISECSP